MATTNNPPTRFYPSPTPTHTPRKLKTSAHPPIKTIVASPPTPRPCWLQRRALALGIITHRIDAPTPKDQALLSPEPPRRLTQKAGPHRGGHSQKYFFISRFHI